MMPYDEEEFEVVLPKGCIVVAFALSALLIGMILYAIFG